MKARKIVHWRISGLPSLNASKVKIKVNIVVSGNGLVEEEDEEGKAVVVVFCRQY